MCLGIPGRVVDTYDERGVRMGKVDFGGVAKRVCLEHTPEAGVDDYVIVHVGFALSVIDEREAAQVFRYLEQMDELAELDQEQPDEVPGRIPRPGGGAAAAAGAG